MYEKITYYSRMSQTLHVPVPVVAGTTLKNGLVAFWDMEDFTDSTGNGHTLSENFFSGTHVTAVSGKINNAQGWTTGNPDGQYNDLYSADAAFNLVGADFSISWWVNFTSIAAIGMTGRGQGPSDAVNVQFKAVTFSATQAALVLNNDGGGSNQLGFIMGPDGITLNAATWYHFAFTVNHLGNITTYFNGSQRSGDPGGGYPTQTAYTVTLPTDTGANLRIAQANGGDGVPFIGGAFDLVGFWSRELSAGEVSDLYNSGNGRAYASF